MHWYVCLLRIAIAIVIGLVIGIDRENKNRPAGMRTHVLVCLGACMIALIEQSFLANIEGSDSHVSYNFGRLCAQVITGVGFLGAGTIITSSKKIVGLTTAASIWNMACLGIAVGYGYYFIAIAGGALVLVVLKVMQRIVHVNTERKLEIKFVQRVETIDFINNYFAKHEIKTLDIDFNVDTSGEENVYTNVYTLYLPQNVNYPDVVNDISEHENVLSIRTTHA